MIFAILTTALPSLAAGPKVHADLIADVSGVSTTPFTVAIRLQVQPGWHVYWQNPGDTGAPPRVKWTLPPGWTAGPLEFPVPKRINLPGGLTAFGYEDQVALLTTLTPDPVMAKRATISARVSWVVCSDVCLAEHQNVSIDLPAADNNNNDAHKNDVTDFARWRAEQPVRDAADAGRTFAVHFNDATHGKIVFTLNAGESPVDFFPPASDVVTYQKPVVAGTSYEIPFTVSPGSQDDFTGLAEVVLKAASGQQLAIESPCAFHFPK